MLGRKESARPSFLGITRAGEQNRDADNQHTEQVRSHTSLCSGKSIRLLKFRGFFGEGSRPRQQSRLTLLISGVLRKRGLGRREVGEGFQLFWVSDEPRRRR